MSLMSLMGSALDLPKIIETQFLKIFGAKEKEFHTEKIFFVIEKHENSINIHQIVNGKIQPNKLSANEIQTILTQ